MEFRSRACTAIETWEGGLTGVNIADTFFVTKSRFYSLVSSFHRFNPKSFVRSVSKNTALCTMHMSPTLTPQHLLKKPFYSQFFANDFYAILAKCRNGTSITVSISSVEMQYCTSPQACSKALVRLGRP